MSRMDFCTMLAYDFMLKEVKKPKHDNVIVSPVSITLVLNMVAAGLKGSTLEYVLGLFGSEDINEINSKSLEIMSLAADVGSTNNGDDGRPVLAMVNGAWADQCFPFKPLYEENILKGIFDCEAKTVDFATQAEKVRVEFNAWAEAVSRGLIKDFFRPGSPSSDTTLPLANGLYFKGIWKHNYRFMVERTERRDFYLLNGRTISVPFMTSSNMYWGGSFDGFKVLQIEYENGKCRQQFYMSFFLPDERDGLQNLLEKLIISKPETYYFNLAPVKLDEFWIPKFKLSYEFGVSEAMEAMGTPLFIANNPADFSEMIHNPEGDPFSQAEILHKACIEIDEKGTEAAALTTAIFTPTSPCFPKLETLSFVVDHPFVFILREARSGLVLFTGVVLDPSQSN
ncbi:hypothetical protein Vadar_011944 [Vaccinium darrowii]|uniref:Uncharacterized protein n=1 Tax=Vaccinium darrowii TaxID=229202 RepID=A0ACB7Y6J1_9ERIC|nr:hypothetical protein Vadar_011944 [Vaccinium darrowii]